MELWNNSQTGPGETPKTEKRKDVAARVEKTAMREKKMGYNPERISQFLGAMARILQVTGARTQVELAEFLGVKQSSISDAKRRYSIPAQWYMTLLAKRGINPLWVEKGVGARHVLGPQAELSLPPLDSLPVEPAQTGMEESAPKRDALPVLIRAYSIRCPVLATEAVSSLPVAGELAVPSAWVSISTMVLLLETDACLPLFPKGAYVGLDTACIQPLPGEYYGIFLAGRGVTIAPISGDPLQCCYLAEVNGTRIECPLPNILGRVAWVWRTL